MGVYHRADDLLPIGLIDAVHLGRDLQRHRGSRSNFDRSIRPLFRRNPTEECEMTTPRLRLECKEVAGKTVINGADPISVRQILALILRDRDEWQPWKNPIERGDIRQIQSAVMSAHSALSQAADQRSVQEVNVKMQDIKLIDPLSDLLQHDDVVRQRIADRRVEANSRVAAWH